jgi:hypothetical protein
MSVQEHLKTYRRAQFLRSVLQLCNIFRRRVVLPYRTNITKVLLRPPWCYHQLPKWCDGDHLWYRLKMLNGVMSRSDTSSRRSQWTDVRTPQNLGRLSDVGSGKRTKSFLSLLARTHYLYYKSHRYRTEYRCRTAVRQTDDLTQAKWSIKIKSGCSTPNIYTIPPECGHGLASWRWGFIRLLSSFPIGGW